MFTLLSELRHPHLSISKKGSAYQKKRQEVVATSVSIVASSITFGITILGSGDLLLGVRRVGQRISASGRAAFGMFVHVRNVSNPQLSSRNCSHRQLSSRSFSHQQLSSRNCCSDVEDIQLDHDTGSESSLSQSEDMQGSSAMHGKAQ
jgi:hypothetical protein